MNPTTSRNVRRWTALAAGCFVVAMSGRALAVDAPQEDQDNGKLVGTWVVQVTLRDCATNAPLGAPFNSLVTFHRGGTVTEDTGATAFAPEQRTAGHGVWTRMPGGDYTQRMIALIRFDTPPNLPGTPGFDPTRPISPGLFAGWQTVTHTLQMTDNDHGVSAGTNEFVRADGTVYRRGCSTAVSQRFE